MFRNSGKTHDKPIMWGGPGSAFSAKVRSYLNKKAIDYQEIFSGQPPFKDEIIPLMGHFVVPVTELEDGTLIQDSTDVILYFEDRYPDNPLIPETPVLKALAWVLGYFGSESFLIPGMHYRWNFLEGRREFLEATFGQFISDARVTDDTIPTIEESFEAFLKLLDAHFLQHPYLLGGRPSLADFGFMCMLFAHISRDLHSSEIMKRISPHAFRWTERMNERSIVNGEFPYVAPEYPKDDTPPETLLPILEYLFADCAPETIATINTYNDWVAAHPDLPAGTFIQADPEAPSGAHPHLGPMSFEQRGTTFHRQAFADAPYHFQRVMEVVDGLDGNGRAKFDALIKSVGGEEMMSMKLSRPIKYELYRYLLA